MTGIAGIISAETSETCKAQLESMLSSMEHESFYNSGKYWLEDMGFYVAWSCHKNAFNDCMPILNEKEDASLFLAGEMIPESEAVTELIKLGHKIQAPGAGYLIHLYEERGTNFLNNLNGWFSGVVVDQRNRCCSLFNDRYGMRRLFVYEGKREFYFASQAKALLAVLPETRDFDPVGLAEFLTCGCTLGIRSLYKDIKILPPASLWTISQNGVDRKNFYFNCSDWESQERLNESRFAQKVVETFPAVVRNYTKGQMPLGISLTGGFDSRLLMACLEMAPGEFPCYSFGSMYRDTFDVSIARRVAEECRQSHTVLVLGQDFLHDFTKYLEDAVSRSDGYIGFSGAAELFVNSLARNIAPVRLTGNYGSELFRGVRAFKSIIPKNGFITPDFLIYLKDAQKQFDELGATDPVSFALFHQAPCQGYGRLAIEESKVIMRTPFMDNGLVSLMYQRPDRFTAATDLYVSIINKNKPNLLKIPTDRGYLGSDSILMQKIRRVYREALFKGEYWASHGMPHWVSALTEQTPWLFPESLLIGRHKFQHFRSWLKKELKESTYKILDIDNSTRLDSYIDIKKVKGLLTDHQNGKRNFSDEIDKLMTIVLADKLLLRNEQVNKQLT